MLWPRSFFVWASPRSAEDEFVARRSWLGRQEFLDLVSAANMIPGPNSTELALHIGHRRAGWAGLLVAGIAFILPSALLVGVLAALYVRYGRLAEVSALLHGVHPVAVAVVLQALLRLGRSAVKGPFLALVGTAALAAKVLGVHELLILFVCGFGCAFAGRSANRSALQATAPLALPALVSASIPGLTTGSLFLFFAKVGSVLFGSGYVLYAFLRADLVERWHWRTEQQLMDAVAAGQVTPGPLFTTATFIGYVLAGLPGAVAATVGIFLPAFVFVAITARWVRRLRASAAAARMLDGVNVASLALMADVAVRLGAATLSSPLAVVLFGAAVYALVRLRLNAAWLVLGGAVVGLALGR